MDMLKKKTRHRLMMLSVLAGVSGLPLSGAMAQEDPSSGNPASPSSEESATSSVSGTASSDYDGGGGGDYDAGGSNTGDYDGVSSAASDAGEGSGGGDIAGAGVADDEDAPKPMSNAELRALADKPTDAGEAPSEASMDAQEKLAEKHGGKVEEKSSVDQFGQYHPGVVENKNGTQTVLLPQQSVSDPTQFGGPALHNLRDPASGTPTGSPIKGTFIQPNN